MHSILATSPGNQWATNEVDNPIHLARLAREAVAEAFWGSERLNGYPTLSELHSAYSISHRKYNPFMSGFDQSEIKRIIEDYKYAKIRLGYRFNDLSRDVQP